MKRSKEVLKWLGMVSLFLGLIPGPMAYAEQCSGHPKAQLYARDDAFVGGSLPTVLKDAIALFNKNASTKRFTYKGISSSTKVGNGKNEIYVPSYNYYQLMNCPTSEPICIIDHTQICGLDGQVSNDKPDMDLLINPAVDDFYFTLSTTNPTELFAYGGEKFHAHTAFLYTFAYYTLPWEEIAGGALGIFSLLNVSA